MNGYHVNIDIVAEKSSWFCAELAYTVPCIFCGKGDINHPTTLELACTTHANRGNMLWAPALKEFQLAGSRRRAFSATSARAPAL